MSEHAREMAQELLPQGHLEGRRWWRCGDIYGSPGQSFAVELIGRRRGRCNDYESGEGCDLLDVATVRYGDRFAALRWVEDRRGAPWREPPPAPATPVRRPLAGDPEDVSQRVKRIWRDARPLQVGDMAWRYLVETRGVALNKLSVMPVALRTHPRLWSTLAERHFPAMVAAVSSPEGKLVGVHRTYLSAVEGRVGKAPIADRGGPDHGAKRSYGVISSNCVPLTRGADGRSWPDPSPNSLLAIGEGIEDCLTLAVERPEWRVACAVSLGNMLSLILSPQITHIVLIGQNDAPGSKAAALVSRIAERFQQQGRKVTLLRPRNRQIKDVNDLARHLTG
jgi:hypothetical protein